MARKPGEHDADSWSAACPTRTCGCIAAEHVLSNEARLQDERSPLARAIAALIANNTAGDRYLDNARAGVRRSGYDAPIHERTDPLISLLADCDDVSLRHYGSEG
jgi:hypothetical protein